MNLHFMNFSFPHLVLAVLVGLAVRQFGYVSPKEYIEVHGLTYVPATSVKDAFIVQDRTVVSGDREELPATWEASVQVKAGLRWSPICAGGSIWPYEAGRAQKEIPFNEWVGEPGCYEKALEYDEIRVCATYDWVKGDEAKCSEGQPVGPIPARFISGAR